MIESIKYNLTHLTDFSGRNSRQTFWYYVLFLVVAQFLIGMAASIPLVMSGMGTAFDAAQSGADQAQLEAQMMAGMADGIGTTVWISAITTVTFALLLVASFVRRLHDAGHPGYWAAIPLVAQAIAVATSINNIGAVQEMMLSASNAVELQQMQSQMTLNPMSYVGWIGILVVIVFGVIKSQEGANKYGEQPQV